MHSILPIALCMTACCIVSISAAKPCLHNPILQCDCTEDGTGKNIICQNLKFKQYLKAMTSADLKSNIISLTLENSEIHSNTSQDVFAGFEWLSKLQSLNLLNLNITFKSLNAFLHSQDNLKELGIKDTFEGEDTLEFKSFGRVFKNLESFSFIGSNIKAIQKGTFNLTCPNVVRLSLDNNMLSKIPREAVAPLMKLESLSLSGNPITDIDDYTVKILQTNLRNLNQLMIDSLHCSCKTYSSDLRKWLVKDNIKDVQCSSPKELMTADIKEIGKDTFCKDNDASFIRPSSLSVFLALTVSIMYLLK